MTQHSGQATFAGGGAVSAGGTALSSLQPDADSTDGGWTDQSLGTSLFAAIDEIISSDADYIQSNTNPVIDICKIRLSDPTGTPTQPFIVLYRYCKAGLSTKGLRVRLLQGTAEIASWLHNDLTEIFVVAEQTLTAAQFAAITDFTNLFLEFSAGEIVYDIATDAWASAVVANGGSVSTGRKIVVDNLILGLKADGLFSKLDHLWLLAAENEQSALTDVIADALATAVGTPIFAIDAGYTSAGVGSYISAGAPGPQFASGNASWCMWLKNSTASDAACFGSAPSNLQPTRAWIRYTDDKSYWRINNDSGDFITTNTDAKGFWVATETGWGVTGDRLLYHNGSLFDTPVDTQGDLFPTSFYFLCNNPASVFGGDYFRNVDDVLSAGGFGAALTATEVLNLSNRVSAYMATVTWQRSIINDGGTVSAARVKLVNELIYGLKVDGVWNKLDRLWLFAAENEFSALRDVVAAAQATAVGGPTFQINMGYTGQDAGAPTRYIDSNFNPSTQGVAYVSNSCHISAWSATNNVVVSGGALLGNHAFTVIIDTLFGGGNDLYARIQDGTPSGVVGNPSTRAGHWVANRSGASASQAYQNGSLFGSPNDNSGGIVSQDFYILAYNNNGPTSSGSPQTVAMSSMGGSLSATDASNFFNRLCDYMGGAFADVWARQVIINGGAVSATRQSLVADLISGLMRDGVWSKLDRLWLFANENQQAALTDIVANALATNVNSTTFTTDRGFTGNGSSMYINSQYDPTGAGNYSQNSANMFAWNNTAGMDGGALCGMADVAAHIRLLPAFTNGLGSIWNINDIRNVQSPAWDGRTGLYNMTRTDASNASLYVSGASIDSYSFASAANASTYILQCLHEGGNFSTRQACCFGFGGGFTALNAYNLNLRLRTYMTAVGVP